MTIHRVGWGLGSMLVFALLCAACGKTEREAGGDGDDPGLFNGVERTKPVGALDYREAQQVCEAFGATLSEAQGVEYMRGFCILSAAEASSSPDSCETLAEECYSLAMGDQTLEFDRELCVADLSTATCDATVAQLQQCLDDQMELFEVAATVESCAQAMGEDALSLDLQPASCAEVVNACFYPVDAQDPGEEVVGPRAAVILGNVDGEVVDIRSDSYSNYTDMFDDAWSTRLELQGAKLWMWGDAQAAQGLIQMPASGPSASAFICLEQVQIEASSEGSQRVWSTSSLSTLGSCGESGGEPLALDFEVGGQVVGTVHGQSVQWTSQGLSCGGAGCSFDFSDVDATWTLEVAALVRENSTTRIPSAVLLERSGAGASACGGAGTLTWSNEAFSIRIDQLGELASCPGTPIDGELSGAM